MNMDGTNSFGSSVKEPSANGTSLLDGVLRVMYDSIAEVNLQLPEHQRIEKSLTTILLGDGGRLDSLGLVNFIVITEQKLEEFLGVRIDLTENDPFSPNTGHFRTVQSLATYICELAENRVGRPLS
ncbi:MAG TPA: acyl carrier protein [Terriglobales bacterium]|jgi:acyl carrier protein|nr:acyl carrier protein [Terriglobales bacterium]